ncbi:MAG: DUF2058 domain-containing protein [Gammaproteobacteria bacterium]
MAKSLQEQLLEAGAVDKSRATKIKKTKHKQGKQRARRSAPPDELKITAQQAQVDKIARDRELSRQQQAKSDAKAIAAQVHQLIERNVVDRDDGELAYNFADQGVIKKIHITQDQQTGLARGRLAVARFDSGYALIAELVAVKITERDPAAVVVMNERSDSETDAGDPYADYQIPDDLTW